MFGKEYGKGEFCPFLRGKCIEDRCRFWKHILGEHPQTGNSVDLWDCQVAWLPVLMADNTRKQRSVAAAVEDLRNKVYTFHQDVTNPPADAPLRLIAEVLTTAKPRGELESGE